MESAEESLRITLKGKPELSIQLDPRFTRFSKLLQSLSDHNEGNSIELNPEYADYDSLRLIVRLLEEHGYDEKNFWTKKPICGKEFEENIDKASFRLIYDIMDNQ